jgi:hypothetical protein
MINRKIMRFDLGFVDELILFGVRCLFALVVEVDGGIVGAIRGNVRVCYNG